jgi:class 3 adenylate cyclase/tetratricopeptide (TPR) repeat protein
MVQQPTYEPHAILVADMVGYSRWLAHQPVATHSAFMTHVRDVFQPTVRVHAGQVVKTTGDGIVAIFKHTGDAENCARDIQTRLQNREIGIAPDVDLKYRIAVHYGKIMVVPDDVFGLDVNAAMHMQSLAPPGGICISGDLFRRLEEQYRTPYTYAGRRYVKNIPEPLDVYLYDYQLGSPRKSPATAQPPTVRRSVLSPPPRVGIAELHAYTEHESQRVVAAFAQEALMEGLSRFRDLFAVSPIGTEVTQGTLRIGKLREHLSKELAIEYLVHGSCFVGSDAITLIIHFEHLMRRELIWATKVQIDPKKLDSVARTITNQCVIPIVLHLRRNESEARDALRHSEDEQLFREAQKLIAQRTLPAMGQARRILAGILERSGEIGNVYVALARAEHSHGQLLAGEQFVESLERARDYARKAIELDELNPRAHGELALQDLFLKRHSSAVDSYQRALQLNPYDPMLLADWADCLSLMGRGEEALSILESISVSWPIDKAFVEWNQCDAEWVMNRPEKIIELLRDKPDQPHVHRYLAASYAKLGRMTEARRHAEKVRAHQPNFSAKAWSDVVPYTNRDAAEEYAEFLRRAGL